MCKNIFAASYTSKLKGSLCLFSLTNNQVTISMTDQCNAIVGDIIQFEPKIFFQSNADTVTQAYIFQNLFYNLTINSATIPDTPAVVINGPSQGIL